MKPIIGLLGFGTVGSGVWKHLEMNAELINKKTGMKPVIKKILERNKENEKLSYIPGGIVTDSFDEILNDPEIKIIIEVMGGIDAAFNFIKRSLESGKHVISANKALIADKGRELREIADKNNVMFRYEASVGGAIPIINALDTSFSGEEISSVEGIINGTTNFILTKMAEEGLSFNDVLAEAQKLGYAEADPTADIEGFDATYKLCILSKKAFGYTATESEVLREGITKVTTDDIAVAKENGYVIKLVATGKKTENGIELRVHPTMLPIAHPLASVNGVFNAVFVKGNASDEIMLYGRGAGDLPTAGAIIGDLTTIIRSAFIANHPYSFDFELPNTALPKDAFLTSYYISMDLGPEVGLTDKILKLLGDNSIKIKKKYINESPLHIKRFTIFTEKTVEYNFINVFNQISKEIAGVKGVSFMRVEE